MSCEIEAKASKARVTPLFTFSLAAEVEAPAKSAEAAEREGYGKASMKDFSILSNLVRDESKTFMALSLEEEVYFCVFEIGRNRQCEITVLAVFHCISSMLARPSDHTYLEKRHDVGMLLLLLKGKE